MFNCHSIVGLQSWIFWTILYCWYFSKMIKPQTNLKQKYMGDFTFNAWLGNTYLLQMWGLVPKKRNGFKWGWKTLPCFHFIYCNNSNAWLLLDVGPIKFFHGCRVSCLITQVSNNTHVKIQCFGQGIKLTGWEI